jgi:hypothetical protein
MGYETLWITQNVRTTAPPRGGPSGAGVGELGVAVASGLAARRRSPPSRSLGRRAN